MLAPERGPRWQIHAQRRNLRISVRPGHPAPAATLPAVTRCVQVTSVVAKVRRKAYSSELRASSRHFLRGGLEKSFVGRVKLSSSRRNPPSPRALRRWVAPTL